MAENNAPEIIMNADGLLQLHPLPWSHHLLLIKDAHGKQVVHTGGLYSEFGRLYEGRYLSGLNALIVESINTRADLAAPDAAQAAEEIINLFLEADSLSGEVEIDRENASSRITAILNRHLERKVA